MSSGLIPWCQTQTFTAVTANIKTIMLKILNLIWQQMENKLCPLSESPLSVIEDMKIVFLREFSHYMNAILNMFPYKIIFCLLLLSVFRWVGSKVTKTSQSSMYHQIKINCALNFRGLKNQSWLVWNGYCQMTLGRRS